MLQDIFEQEQHQQAWRDCITEVVGATKEELAKESFRSLAFENYDTETHTMLLQVTSRQHYEWMETDRVRTWFYGQLKRHFPDIEVLNYRVPKE